MSLPVCQFGTKCYRKNPQHFKEYAHPWLDQPQQAAAAPAPAAPPAAAAAAAAAAAPADAAAAVATIAPVQPGAGASTTQAASTAHAPTGTVGGAAASVAAPASAPAHATPVAADDVSDAKRVKAAGAATADTAAAAAALAQPAVISMPPAIGKTASRLALESQLADASYVSYLTVLRAAVKSGKVSADSKRVLRDMRRDLGLSEQHHTKALDAVGWSEAEYDDGEKEVDDPLLPEEVDVLSKQGVGVVTLKKGALASAAHDSVFTLASSLFFQRLTHDMVGNTNFAVPQIDVIVNKELRAQFERHRTHMHVEPEWVFHGTSNYARESIQRLGFLLPKDNPGLAKGKVEPGAKVLLKKPLPKPQLVGKAAQAAQASASAEAAAAASATHSLAVHFAVRSDPAVRMAQARGQKFVIACQLLRGSQLHTVKAWPANTNAWTMAQPAAEKGVVFCEAANEYLVYNTELVLPRYVIYFEAKAAVERPQEF